VGQPIRFLALGLLSIFVLGLFGCDAWDRLKNAKSVSLVSVEFNNDLKEISKDGVVKNDLVNTNVGLGEAAGVVGGLFQGKAVEKTQDVLKERTEKEAITRDNMLKFQEGFIVAAKDAFEKSRFTVKPYDLINGVDVRNNDLSKGILAECGSDAIIKINSTIGYVKEDKNFGLTKEYRLAIITEVFSADKEGFIGFKKYFIISPKGQTSDASIPAFQLDDFNSLLNELIGKIRTDMMTIKLK